MWTNRKTQNNSTSDSIIQQFNMANSLDTIAHVHGHSTQSLSNVRAQSKERDGGRVYI